MNRRELFQKLLIAPGVLLATRVLGDKTSVALPEEPLRADIKPEHMVHSPYARVDNLGEPICARALSLLVATAEVKFGERAVGNAYFLFPVRQWHSLQEHMRLIMTIEARPGGMPRSQENRIGGLPVEFLRRDHVSKMVTTDTVYLIDRGAGNLLGFLENIRIPRSS